MAIRKFGTSDDQRTEVENKLEEIYPILKEAKSVKWTQKDAEELREESEK